MLMLQLVVKETAAWPRNCQVEDMGGGHESTSLAALQATQIEASRTRKLHQDHQFSGKADNSCSGTLLRAPATPTRMPAGHDCARQACSPSICISFLQLCLVWFISILIHGRV